MKVGFIGLGVMGKSMAMNIMLKKFGQITVWNRTASKARELEGVGATVVPTPADVARQCDVICLCVSDTPDVQDVIFGENGVAKGLSKGKLILDFSTISVKETEKFAQKMEEIGCGWIDAPVSGGDVGAKKGTLTVMAGGKREDFDRAKPIFDAVGSTIIYMGPSGNGQRTKLANQIAVCGTIVAMAEAFGLASQCKLKVDKVLDVISSGAAGSWTLSNYGPRVLAGNFDPGFAVRLMAKDLRLVEESLELLDGEFATVRYMKRIFDTMVEKGEGNLGIHASVKYLGWLEEEEKVTQEK